MLLVTSYFSYKEAIACISSPNTCLVLSKTKLLDAVKTLLLSYLEANEGNLHGQDGAQAVDSAVGHIDAVREPACQHQNQDVKGDKVDEEHIAAPGRHLEKQTNTPSDILKTLSGASETQFGPTYHVKVGQRTN